MELFYLKGEILADLETPLSIFLKLYDEGKYRILLESAEGDKKWGRYSFIVFGSCKSFKFRKGFGEIYDCGRVEYFKSEDPLEELKRFFKSFKGKGEERFDLGIVGFVGYDLIKFYEPVRDELPDPINTYDLLFTFGELTLIYDNFTRSLKILIPYQKGEEEYAKERLKRVLKKIYERVVPQSKLKVRDADLSSWKSNLKKEEFLRMVERAKEYIRDGDVIQVVLSQRFKRTFKGRVEDVYRILRTLNPSPYMFFMDFGELKVVGSSPEVLVRVEGEKVLTRPIAGTRRRGKDEEEDERLSRELLSDEKERAEHLMLVDLARNDLGKVCKGGSVKVKDFMRVEKYSHVMHIVSDVEGTLREDTDPFEVLKAVFPAGTVSGAPKVRAMQIIEELERERRGIYAGSVGYFSLTGNMDMAIAIRTLIFRDKEVFLQAGAGIVSDSVPEREYEETLNKAKALMVAVDSVVNSP